MKLKIVTTAVPCLRLRRICALLFLCALTAIASSAQTLTTLHAFDSTDGSYPFGGVVQALDGNLYGTTHSGGSANDGTVFKVSPGGAFTSLKSFDGTDGADLFDQTGLVQGSNGNLYGTAGYGGTNNRGTVFKISTAGKLTTIYNLCEQESCTDGSSPYDGLVLGTNGELYGTTDFGGNYAYGEVFSITTAGKIKTIYSFCPASGCTDGARPTAGLIQASNGDFYGTTEAGGANKNSMCSVEGCGTIFKVTASGGLTTLYNFCAQSGCADGQTPYAGLIQGSDGNFYGTTTEGGPNNDGTVFKITPTGEFTTLWTFCSKESCADGIGPEGGLIQATDGNFYGTTSAGGSPGSGTIFKITSGGALTTVYNFCTQTGCADGGGPYAGVIQGTNGDFYGTTEEGGINGYGVVYSLSTGLGPFVQTKPTSGKVGKAVQILGTDLTGATSVTFNGTAATFTVVSGSEITTKVPTGATTGPVQVVTPGATLTSNVAFTVVK
jgi:uncharacterized repeat protein (TIGR03803 family)